ncbi:glycerol-3-phosphate acyltransferase 1, mitochondrial-like isoform X3 [Xenia sp. Carnegie-2017]|uniref:glycerol-3-phosphate acyltransferase 1, mitochondrial-like isoform X3 n=1 Tax=Xenia sp. Carnegie-2017 TaxID=2897299 RepID=UPI001F044545|nr:glycerol-3-phosphate acyltransferase 1, mitochondrial-like isoform X3 [Xenia sp. Carnegie-2017]
MMNASSRESLDDVFKKWEKRGEERRQNGPCRNVNNSDEKFSGYDARLGRSAWQRKFETSSLPRRKPKQKKKREITHFDSNDFLLFDNVEKKFQLSPAVLPDSYCVQQQFLGVSCPKFTKNKISFEKEQLLKNSPLRNLLDMSVFCRKYMFRSAFCDMLYVVNLPKCKSVIPRIDNKKILYSRLQDEKEASPKQLNQESKKIIDGMTGRINAYLTKVVSWILFKFLGNILSSIHVHEGQTMLLKDLNQANTPLVYLMIYKNHIDYVLLPFILNWYGIKVPYFAIEDGLKNIPVLSYLMRNVGGFFVRKHPCMKTLKDKLYNIILDEYIAKILVTGNNLSIPLETNVLSSVMSAVQQGRVQDVMIVPVAISYEKILLDHREMTLEVQGAAKSTKSFFKTMKNLLATYRTYFGQVRINFGMPASLTGYVKNFQSSEFWKTTTDASKFDILSKKDKSPDESLVMGISNHIAYDCVQNSTIMATNAVAFLLLTKFREGVKMKKIDHELELLKKDIVARKRGYGFSGKNEEVVLHAIRLLDEHVSYKSETNFIQPILTLPSLLELSFYARQVFSVFIFEAIVACSIAALLTGQNLTLSELICQPTTLSRRELLNASLDLCDLLQKEFIYTRPCVSLESLLIEAIDMFIAADILKVCEDAGGKSRRREWADRLALSTAWSDDEDSGDEVEISDQEYKVAF